MSVVNLNSHEACKRAYLNYHCYGNTMGISEQDMGAIASKWSAYLSSWQSSVETDDIDYDFDDSEYEEYINTGKEHGEDVTGYQDSQADDIAIAGGHVLGSAGGAVLSTVATGASTSIVNTVGGKVIGEATSRIAGEACSKTVAAAGGPLKDGAIGAGVKAAGDATNECAKGIGDVAGFIVGCTLGFITAATYWIKRANKDEHEAAVALMPEHSKFQADLNTEQGNMNTYAGEIVEASDEATDANEEGNEDIQKKKAEYDQQKQIYLALKAKIDSGVSLSASEKALYNGTIQKLGELATEIDALTALTQEKVEEKNEDLSDFQSKYDETAATMGFIQGVTEYAASFDKTAEILCYVEGAAQVLNGASSAYSAYEAGAFALSGTWAFGATAWAWAFVALGIAAVVSSGIAAGEQFTWAGEIGKEIDARESTEELNASTMEIYEAEVDAYDGAIDTVSDLELAVPEDIEAPEATPLPQEPVVQPQPAGSGLKNDNIKKPLFINTNNQQ